MVQATPADRRQVSALTFTASVIASGRLGGRPMHVADVGVSGGFDRKWEVFGPGFAGCGFDPLIAEIERLRKEDTRNLVRYEAARVGCRDYDQLFPPDLRGDAIRSRTISPFWRSSALAAHAASGLDYVRQHFNHGAEVAYTDRVLTLDEYYADAAEPPQFLKIDTDGADIEVLLGAQRLLASPDLLGLTVETRFEGAVHPYSNVFCNIDRLLRDCGFTLFALPTYQYSRAALPAPFLYDLFAQTTSGQVIWGEALYFRDFTEPRYEQMFDVQADERRLLQLACLWNLHGLHDCAAELLITREPLARLPEREQWLDALAADAGAGTSYEEVRSRFEADPSSFFSSRRAQAAASNIVPRPAARAVSSSISTPTREPAGEELAHRLERVEAENAALREREIELGETVTRMRVRNIELKQKIATLRNRMEARKRGSDAPEGAVDDGAER